MKKILTVNDYLAQRGERIAARFEEMEGIMLKTDVDKAFQRQLYEQLVRKMIVREIEEISNINAN